MAADRRQESHSARGQVRAASQSQVQVLIDNASQIISDVGGELEGSEAQRNLAVFFRSGVFVVEKKSRWNPQVVAFREIIRRRRRILDEIYVDLEIIRILYETYRKSQASGGKGHGPRVVLHGHGSDEGVTPMQREVIKLLTHAASLKASDIHVVVGYHEAQVRMRLDGDLYNMYQMPSDVAHELLAAAYNMSDTADASYRILEYQAARISSHKSPLPAGLQGVRLQFNPLESGGRYMIARMLYAEERSKKKVEIGSLGFHGVHIGMFDHMRARPEGVNFVSGPTGSGKSTTLKIALEAVYRDRQGKINILTIEDPPEYTITGAEQLPVTNVETEEDRGAAYNKAIVAALRSDPDVIMPGEARDRNVIALVFTAAMTGHQVWTSIHANSAMAIFDRVKDQGVEPYKLYDPDLITGLLAQRLLRQLCPTCKIPIQEGLASGGAETIKKSTLASIVKLSRDHVDSVFLVNRKGCSDCSGGYKGRSVVAEIIVPDYDFMELMRQDKKPDALRHYEDHLEGMSMKEHAWLKMVNGLVDPRDLEDRLGPLSLMRKERIPALLRIEERYKNV